MDDRFVRSDKEARQRRKNKRFYYLKSVDYMPTLLRFSASVADLV